MALPKSSRQPDPKPLAPSEALAKDSREKEHHAVTARRPTPPTEIGNKPPRPTPASPQHAHLGPVTLPKGNQQPDLKPLPLLNTAVAKAKIRKFRFHQGLALFDLFKQ